MTPSPSIAALLVASYIINSLFFKHSNAKPKIADYAFTTVVPNLGVCDLLQEATDHAQDRDGAEEGGEGAPSLVIADIPGLLEGAHAGVGLGTAFLRHVQRCR